jgi:hypothetical protein
MCLIPEERAQPHSRALDRALNRQQSLVYNNALHPQTFEQTNEQHDQFLLMLGVMLLGAQLSLLRVPAVVIWYLCS